MCLYIRVYSSLYTYNILYQMLIVWSGTLFTIYSYKSGNASEIVAIRHDRVKIDSPALNRGKYSAYPKSNYRDNERPTFPPSDCGGWSRARRPRGKDHDLARRSSRSQQVEMAVWKRGTAWNRRRLSATRSNNRGGTLKSARANERGRRNRGNK